MNIMNLILKRVWYMSYEHFILLTTSFDTKTHEYMNKKDLNRCILKLIST